MGYRKDKNLELTIREILKSHAQSCIYLYLLRKGKARTEEIIHGTKLHPSTVRETLSKMYTTGLVLREKIKNDNIGKNPYQYYPISPIQLVKRYTMEMERKLNRFINLSSRDKEHETRIKIVVCENNHES